MLGEDLIGLERVGHILDVVVDHWVATLTHSRLSDGIFEDLKCLLVQLIVPVVRLV